MVSQLPQAGVQKGPELWPHVVLPVWLGPVCVRVEEEIQNCKHITIPLCITVAHCKSLIITNAVNCELTASLNTQDTNPTPEIASYH